MLSVTDRVFLANSNQERGGIVINCRVILLVFVGLAGALTSVASHAKDAASPLALNRAMQPSWSNTASRLKVTRHRQDESAATPVYHWVGRLFNPKGEPGLHIDVDVPSKAVTIGWSLRF